MKIENLREGQTVYEVRRSKMGNTSMSTTSCYCVRIVSINLQRRVVTASWNSNPPREYHERTWNRWQLKKPVLVSSGFGQRLATREELKAMKQESRGE